MCLSVRRIIDEFLAKSNQREPCKSFEETCEVVGRVAFKMFLGVEADVRNWNEDKSWCSLVFPENPLNENVELPPGKNFLYSNIICGAIRGAREQILYKVDVYCVHCPGDDTNEIEVTFVSRLQAEMDDRRRVASMFFIGRLSRARRVPGRARLAPTADVRAEPQSAVAAGGRVEMASSGGRAARRCPARDARAHAAAGRASRHGRAAAGAHSTRCEECR